MFKKVLVSLDGSPLAENALAHLPLLFTPKETEIVLLKVIELYNYAIGYDSIMTISMIEHLYDGAREYLGEQAKLLEAQGFTVTYKAVDGTPADKILLYAKDVEADMIAMTTHGRSGIARWAMGSVAERVLHGADVPVLLTREGTEVIDHKIQRILVPLDGSPLAEQAIPIARRVATQTGAEILFLEVVQKMNDVNKEMIYGSVVAGDKAFQDYLARAEEYLYERCQESAELGVVCTHLVLTDDPANSICNVAENQKMDLTIISTHGRTGIGRWAYGSTAGKVLGHITRPLLLIRSVADDS